MSVYGEYSYRHIFWHHHFSEESAIFTRKVIVGIMVPFATFYPEIWLWKFIGQNIVLWMMHFSLVFYLLFLHLRIDLSIVHLISLLDIKKVLCFSGVWLLWIGQVISWSTLWDFDWSGYNSLTYYGLFEQ